MVGLALFPQWSWQTSLWYPRKKTLRQLVHRASAHHSRVNHDCIHGGKILALMSLAAAFSWTLLRMRKSQTTLVALEFRQIWTWAWPAGIWTGADVSWAVWRVVEAVVLAPCIHGPPKSLVCYSRNAHLAAHHQRSLTILCCCVPDHDCPWIVRGWKKPCRVDNPHICAVPESLLRAATQACRPVFTVAPWICRGPSPLKHTSLARQSFGQSCLPLQKKLVLSFKYWKFVLSVQLGEGMLVQTLLCCLLAPSLNWAKLEREPALVVGRQLHFQLDHRVLDVGLGDHCIAVIPSRLMVLRTWLIVSIPTHATPG